MDFPLAEELELLESAFQDDQPVDHFDEYVPAASPDGRKRGHRLDSDASPETLAEEKRRRKSPPENDEEDDPIALPPSREQLTVTSPIRTDDERFLRRFASEIDGECIPVTGPCGNRVYAKMSTATIGSGAKELRTEQSGR